MTFERCFILMAGGFFPERVNVLSLPNERGLGAESAEPRSPARLGATVVICRPRRGEPPLRLAVNSERYQLARSMITPCRSAVGELITPALCSRSRAVCGRKTPTQLPKRLWRAIMPKLPSAGAVCTNALLAIKLATISFDIEIFSVL